MISDLKTRLNRFGAQSQFQNILQKPNENSTMNFISGMLDSMPSIILREGMDAIQRNPKALLTASSHSDSEVYTETYNEAIEKFSALKTECNERFVEFRDKWKKRLSYAQLHPYLARNQWFTETIEGHALVGKGSRKEAKTLYIQSLHDMSSDCERTVSAISGIIFRLQQQFAQNFSQQDQLSKHPYQRLLMVLESGIRQKEFEIFKKIRLSLNEMALETFVNKVNKWDKKFYPNEQTLFAQIAAPWHNPYRYESGFEGFMQQFSGFAESYTEHMIMHFQKKWELLLKGVAVKEFHKELSVPC